MIDNSFHIITFGCQMNVHDSQWLARALEARGFCEAPLEEARVVVVNTCSVREKPEQKVMSTLGRIRQVTGNSPRVLVAVTGCVAQQLGEKLFSRQVRLVAGSDGISGAPQAIERLLDEPASYYYGVLWNKLYRAPLIRDNGIRFSSDFDWSEDFLFNLEYIRYAERFAALDRPVYYYVKNESSITHTQLDVANVLKTKAVLFTYYKDLYEKLGLYDACKAQVYKYLIATAEHN